MGSREEGRGFGLLLAVRGETVDLHVLVGSCEVMGGIRCVAFFVRGVVTYVDHLDRIGELVAVVPRIDLLWQRKS